MNRDTPFRRRRQNFHNPYLSGYSHGVELVGSHISAVVEKAAAGGWTMDFEDGHVDFFNGISYPFRLELNAAGIVTAISRPPELMDRYRKLVGG